MGATIFNTYKGRTLVQMKIHANQQRAEIERLRKAAEEAVYFIENGRQLGFIPCAPSQPALDACRAALQPLT